MTPWSMFAIDVTRGRRGEAVSYLKFRWTRLGRLIDGALWRFPPYKRLTSRLVWAELQRNPGFMEHLNAGIADAEAGRFYNEAGVPAESWRADDPIQPEGWFHDGQDWDRLP